MNNLSFHITDIATNSIRAAATEIRLDITVQSGLITLRVADNGCGMDADTLAHATNPFYTTRTTRKVGLGLPFLIQNAEQSGGEVTIDSTPGVGTCVTARFMATHIDCPPWGDLPGTVALLMTGNPEINLRFTYQSEVISFALSTDEILEILDGLPISHPQVTRSIKEMIKENVTAV